MFIIMILFLLLMSAFFSGSESALTSLSDYKIRKLYNKHKWLRSALKLWICRPYRIIIAILLGNTMVNLLISSYSTDLFVHLPIKVSLEIKEFVVWIMVTITIIIFAELIPKVLSKNFPERITKIILLPIYVIHYLILIIFLPIFYLVEKHIKKEEATFFTKIEELKKTISDSSKTIFHKDINELFERAIKFNEIRIKDIMTPKIKVEMVNITNKNISTIMEQIIETGKTRVPLCDGNDEKIIGFAMVKDLFYLCSSGIECSVSDLVHPILEFNINTKAKDAIKEFKNTQIHIAKVVDDSKKFVGIITLEDIIEEVVGDILDEYDIRAVSK